MRTRIANASSSGGTIARGIGRFAEGGESQSGQAVIMNMMHTRAAYEFENCLLECEKNS